MAMALGGCEFEKEKSDKLMELGTTEGPHTWFDCQFIRDQPRVALWFIRPG